MMFKRKKLRQSIKTLVSHALIKGESATALSSVSEKERGQNGTLCLCWTTCISLMGGCAWNWK